MLLDTGAESSSFDTALVKKLGLKTEGERVAVGIEGARKGCLVRLRGFTAGPFDTRAMSNEIPVAAFDFAGLNEARVKRKMPRCDGLLGDAFLRNTKAVIDYPGRTLYVRTPLAVLWPQLAGKWVHTGGEEDGRPRQPDPTAPAWVEFKDRQLHMTDGPNRYRYGMHPAPYKDGYGVALFRPEEEYAEKLTYRTGGLLKVADGRLSLCLALDPTKIRAYPEEFKAPAGSGHQLLEFKREP